MVSFFNFIYHTDGIVGIGNHGFAAAVQGQFFSAEDVFPASFSISPEIAGRAYIGPADVFSFAEFDQLFDLGSGEGFENIREFRGIHHLHSVFLIDIEGACSACHQESGFRAGKDITEMSESGGMPG